VVAPPEAASAEQPFVEEIVEAPPEPRIDDVLVEEREIFAALEATRKRLSELPAHEVLGVPPDADARKIRGGYFVLTKRYHPDVYGRYRSPALRRLASDVFIHINRAFDRMRLAKAVGPARGSREGWLADMDDMQASNSQVSAMPLPPPTVDEPPAPSPPPASPYSEMVIHVPGAPRPDDYSDDVRFTTSVRMKALTAEELFDGSDDQLSASPPTVPPKALPTEAAVTLPMKVDPPPASEPEPSATGTTPPAATPVTQGFVDGGREHLAAGRFKEACEAFAAALRADPRNRSVRALYHVASGMDLRARGEGAKATLQFETALAHDRGCEEARRALQQNAPEPDKKGLFRKFFDR
jgi:hypothetical protein